MGIFSTFFYVIVPGTAYATWMAFRLGKELPLASRKLGRKVGMGYNYFKVVLRLMAAQKEQ